MRYNPLTRPIANILHNAEGSLSEYELLSQLKFEGINLEFDNNSAEGCGDLILFRKHFLIMNALYTLQPVFWDEGYLLTISALEIKLSAKTSLTVDDADTQGDTLPSSPGDHGIASYYLDWQQFDESSNESVEKLLNSFWQRYFAEDETENALTVLQLEADCSLQQIKQAYRRLAATHHPDKGGDADRFIEIRDAYELLACSKR